MREKLGKSMSAKKNSNRRERKAARRKLMKGLQVNSCTKTYKKHR